MLVQKWYSEDLDSAIPALLNDEKNGKVDHRFIIFPFSARVEIVHDKHPKSTLKPKFSIKTNVNELNFQFFIFHLQLLVKFQKFLNFYDKFKKRIENSLLSKKLTVEQGVLYHKKYKKLRKSFENTKIFSEKLVKLKKKIENLEEGVNTKEIIKIRKQVLMDIKLETIKNNKEKEIQSFSANNQRKFSTKLINFFGRKSINEEEHDRAQQL